MAQIGLLEAIEQLRAELTQAVSAAKTSPIQFPVGQITVEFQVGATRSADGSGGVNFWILDLSSSAGFTREQVQKVTVVLEPPVTAQGHRLSIADTSTGRLG